MDAMRNEDVKVWLKSIPEYKEYNTTVCAGTAAPEQVHKRPYPLSPPPESSCMEEFSTPPKRRKLDDSTPLARTLNPRAPRSASSSPTKSSASFRSSSQASQASSSRRKFAALDICDEGVFRQQLSGPQTKALPAPIKEVLVRLRQLERGKGILSKVADKDIFREFLDENELGLEAFAVSGHEGSSLTPTDTIEIESAARRCFVKSHDEAAWNADVHNRLFDKVFRKYSSTEEQVLVDFTICTGASIIRKYLPEGLPDQRIDFCHYIDPLAEPEYAAKIDALRQELPEASINHTSYTALLGCPTTGSTETKRHGENFDGVVLQIAVWQAAQWKMLRVLLRKAALRRRAWSPASLSQDDVFIEQESVAHYVEESLRKLGAIHGTYTQGHEWYYFATSPEVVDPQGRPSLKTVLWLYERIGNTASTMGVHRIAAYLEYHKTWSASTYWPWFKQYVLD